MLVLTRRIGERIVIGDQIILEVLSVKGNRIRLGIAAPPDVTVLRNELLSAPADPKPESSSLPLVIDIEV
jgi:carbon storage regulator